MDRFNGMHPPKATASQSASIKMAKEALEVISDDAFVSLAEDRAVEMPPKTITKMASKLTSIAWHKSRGDLDVFFKKNTR